MTACNRPIASRPARKVTEPRGGFSPASLFAAGEAGAWYDPSDLSTLFQDSAGTTPVTATGQPVGKMLDKSGRGNHATQATSAARPVLQQDAGGRYYLAFDGVDDHMVCSAVPLGGALTSMSCAGVQHDTSTNYVYSEQNSATTNQINGQLQAPAGKPKAAYRGDSGAPSLQPAGAVSFAGSPYVMTATNDGASPAIRANGVQQATAAGTMTTVTTNQATIGASRPGSTTPTAFLVGRLYGLVVVAGSPAARVSLLESYMALKTGAAL